MTTFLYQPPRPDRKIKTMIGKAPERKADRTLDHVTKGWLPVNPTVFKAIKEQLHEGAFHKDPEGLLAAIKKDPGTFFHFAKQLSHYVDPSREGTDPLQALKSLEQEKVEKIFSISDREVSHHRLWEATPTQLLRAQHAVISSRAAEVLAETVHAPSSLAFSGALMRQLGSSLLAWNYPDIYARLVSQARTKKIDIDIELQKLLGTTPAQIATKFASAWNLSTEIRRSLLPRSGTTAPDATTELQQGTASLSTIYEVSELFAQANDPEHFPEATRRWEETSEIVVKNLGLSLPEVIKPQVDEAFQLVESAAHHAVKAPFFFSKPAPPDELHDRGKDRYERNHFLQRCPEEVRHNFRRVYARLASKDVSVDALKVLVDEVVPTLGFERGCLYLMNQQSGRLNPTLRVGDKPLSAYRSYSDFENQPVAESLQSLIPLRRHSPSGEGRETAKIYAAFGSERYPGVLELELTPSADENPSHPATLFFQAARQALIDCLD